RGRDGCATRVHTIPDALATSIAATRSQVCSCSSSSISCGSRIAGDASSHPWARSRAARGPRSGTESLTGVLEAQCATRQGQSPSARLNPRAHDPETIPASAGNPTTFSRSRDVPAGHLDLSEFPPGRRSIHAADSSYPILVSALHPDCSLRITLRPAKRHTAGDRCRPLGRWDSNPPSGSFSSRRPGGEGRQTCGWCIPVVTARALRGPAVPDAVWTQHGPPLRHGTAGPVWPRSPLTASAAKINLLPRYLTSRRLVEGEDDLGDNDDHPPRAPTTRLAGGGRQDQEG